MVTKFEILLQEAVKNEPIVEDDFDKVIGIWMKKYNSLTVPSWIITNPINRIFPIFY